MARDLKRAIFIGVGGSGGTTLRYLYRELELRLGERSWDRGMPDGWQFLHVDVAEKPDGIYGDVPRDLVDPEHFFGLAKEPLDMAAYLNMIPQTSPDVLAGWSPSPRGSYGSLWLGAGQRRAVGRVVAMTHLSGLQNRINNMRTKMESDISGMQEVAKAFGVDADTDSAPNVYLISSLGGGSGSGVFLDVSLLLETMKIRHATVLFTPDVFDELTTATGMNRNSLKFAISGNTLGAMSELLSAHEHQGPYSPADSAVLRLSGTNNVTEGRRTTETHFFIGRRGMGGFELPTQNSVYHAAARALTAITVNGQLAEQMSNYVMQNSTSLSPVSQALVAQAHIIREQTVQAGMSFGYAAVSVGRQAFAAYAAERLTRQLVAELADDDAAIKKLVERDNSRFLEKSRFFAEQCGLREVSADFNQITDAIRGGRLELMKEITDAVKRAVADGLKKKSTNINPEEWNARIETDFKAAIKTATADFSGRMLTNAKAWTTSIQPVVLEQTVASAAKNGLGMTIAFLEQLEIDLNTAIDELRADVPSYRNEIPRALAQAKESLTALGKKVRLVVGEENDKGPISMALEGRRNAFSWQCESDVRALTADLISDFTRNFLKPLTFELKRARGQFQVDIERTGVKEVWSDWATGPVPTRLQPSENEVFLETTDTFANSFDVELQDSLNANTPSMALSLASAEVLSGVWPGRETQSDESMNRRLATVDERFAHQTRIIVNALWGPEIPSVRPESGASVASFEVDLDVSDLLQTAKQWTRERVGFKNFSQITMSDYLYEPVPDQADRRQKFAEALSEAFQKAALMVRVDSDLLQALVGTSEIGEDHQITTIPILLKSKNGKRTTEGDEVMNVLTGIGGMDGPQAEAMFDQKSTVKQVEIVCFTNQRVHPFAISSVVAPIAEAWAQASMSPNDRAQFWQLRRAKTLASFVPVAPTVQLRMARGWIVARLLGYIDESALTKFLDTNGQSALTIYDPGATTPNGKLHFPAGLLDGGPPGIPMAPETVFPSLIESMPLAYLALASGSAEELGAYTRMAVLGTNLGTTELNNWIQTGILPNLRDSEGCPVVVKTDWSSLTDAESRTDVVLKNLEMRRESLQPYIDRLADMDNLDSLDRVWELRDQLVKAIETLEQDVRNMSSGQRNNDIA